MRGIYYSYDTRICMFFSTYRSVKLHMKRHQDSVKESNVGGARALRIDDALNNLHKNIKEERTTHCYGKMFFYRTD